MREETREMVARICHEMNRTFCRFVGDESQPPWDEAPEWQRKATFETIDFGGRWSPEERHAGWAAAKISDGWKYGPVKDAAAKTHPCLVPYAELPAEERLKDQMMGAVIDSYLRESAKEAA